MNTKTIIIIGCLMTGLIFFINHKPKENQIQSLTYSELANDTINGTHILTDGCQNRDKTKWNLTEEAISHVFDGEFRQAGKKMTFLNIFSNKSCYSVNGQELSEKDQQAIESFNRFKTAMKEADPENAKRNPMEVTYINMPDGVNPEEYIKAVNEKSYQLSKERIKVEQKIYCENPRNLVGDVKPLSAFPQGEIAVARQFNPTNYIHEKGYQLFIADPENLSATTTKRFVDNHPLIPFTERYYDGYDKEKSYVSYWVGTQTYQNSGYIGVTKRGGNNMVRIVVDGHVVRDFFDAKSYQQICLNQGKHTVEIENHGSIKEILDLEVVLTQDLAYGYPD